MSKPVQTIQGPKKFTISPHTAVGDIITFRGKKFECTHRRETLTSAGKPGVAFEFVAACDACGIRYGQGIGPFGRLNKTCSNPECRMQARSSNGRPAKKGGYLEWDGGPIKVGQVVCVVQGKARARVAEATAVKLGHLGVYEAVHFSIPCDRCLLPISQAVVATPGSNKWVRTVCCACEPKSGGKKAKSSLGKPTTEQKQGGITPKPVIKRAKEITHKPTETKAEMAVRRAKEINPVIEKAQMAPRPSIPTPAPVEPKFEDLVAQMQRNWAFTQKTLAGAGQPALLPVAARAQWPAARKDLLDRIPRSPLYLQAAYKGLLVELDRLLSGGVSS